LTRTRVAESIAAQQREFAGNIPRLVEGNAYHMQVCPYTDYPLPLDLFALKRTVPGY